MRRTRWAWIGAAVAVCGLSGTAHADRGGAPVPHARALCHAALRLERSARVLVLRRDGSDAAKRVHAAETDLRAARGALRRAGIDSVDEQAIAGQISLALQLDAAALRGGPDGALTDLAAAVGHTQAALTMIRGLADDGGGIPA